MVAAIGMTMITTTPSAIPAATFSAFGFDSNEAATFFSTAATVTLIYRPPALPNKVSLYAGAIT